ncbi:MAG TPA: DUF1802 family protein [Nitrospiria bacterium]|nr:DUF1802 family protein [Nitrospiria bacterium]
MQRNNRFALKEWAIILRALAEGRQVLLLRKGGLIENTARFKVEHTEFFIYPTYLHQQRRGIIPAWRKYLDQILAAPPPKGEVHLTHYAVVQQMFKITEPERIKTLSAFHVLNEHEVRKRFFYGQAPGLNLVLLRVFQLAESFRIPVQPSYAGCRSWVDLGQEIPTSRCRPVLGDDTFAMKARRIAARLNPSHQPS